MTIPMKMGRTTVPGVAALMVAACLFLAPTTADARTVTGDINGLDPAATQQCGLGSLTVKLPVGNPNDDVPAGELPPGALAGTTFTAQQVSGIDLGTAEGWAKARSISVKEAQKGPFGVTKSAVTDDTGTAVIKGLPVGLYLITAKTPDDPAHAYPKLTPFLVTVPTGGIGENGPTGKWDCDSVVFAKATPEPGPLPTPTTQPNVPTTNPNEPTTNPGEPTTNPGEEPGTQGHGGQLPITGAAVVGLVIIAAILIAIGLPAIALSRRKNRK